MGGSSEARVRVALSRGSVVSPQVTGCRHRVTEDPLIVDRTMAFDVETVNSMASKTPLRECAPSMIESPYSLQTIGATAFVLQARSSPQTLMLVQRARRALTSVGSWVPRARYWSVR